MPLSVTTALGKGSKLTESCDHPPRLVRSFFNGNILTMCCSACQVVLVGAAGEEEVTRRVHRNGSVTVEYRYKRAKGA